MCGLLASFIDATLGIMHDILSVVLIQIRKGRQQYIVPGAICRH
jgi:hypothetical protein